MTIIDYLKTLKPKTNVSIFLRENNKNHMIAATTADILLQSKKEGFRKLEVVDGLYLTGGVVVIVEHPTDV